VHPENKGFKNPFEIKPNTPANHKKPTQNQRAQSKRGFAPLISTKNRKKLGDFGEVGFRGLFVRKREIGEFGWPAVGGLVGERPAVMFWWWGRRWVVVGVG
jgi:hypothetical protein